MAYCKECGTQMSSTKKFCPNCGAENEDVVTFNQYYPIDNGGFAWGILGFFLPVLGLILYFVWKKSRPNTSIALLAGSLISIGLIVVFEFASSGLLRPY